RELTEELLFQTYHHGFTFLNSCTCEELHEKTRLLEREILKDNVIEQTFLNDNDDYENELIQNIYNYCFQTSFNRGIFMCGDAHRKSISFKIEKHPSENKPDIQWKYYS